MSSDADNHSGVQWGDRRAGQATLYPTSAKPDPTMSTMNYTLLSLDISLTLLTIPQ